MALRPVFCSWPRQHLSWGFEIIDLLRGRIVALRPNPSNGLLLRPVLTANLPAMADFTAAARPPPLVNVPQTLRGEFSVVCKKITNLHQISFTVVHDVSRCYILSTEKQLATFTNSVLPPSCRNFQADSDI